MSYLYDKIEMPLYSDIVMNNINKEIKKLLDLSIAELILSINKIPDNLFSHMDKLENCSLKIFTKKMRPQITYTIHDEYKEQNESIKNIIDKENRKFYLISLLFKKINIAFPDVCEDIHINLKNYKDYINKTCQSANISDPSFVINKKYLNTFNKLLADRSEILGKYLFINLINKYGVDLDINLTHKNGGKVLNLSNTQQQSLIEADEDFILMKNLYNAGLFITTRFNISDIIKINPEMKNLILGKEEFDLLKEKDEINNHLSNFFAKSGFNFKQ